MENEQFYMMPKILARADGFISKKTGEPVELTSSSKIVYTYMLYRNSFFLESLGNKHYESQATVADACGLEYKATGKILRLFLEHGIIDGDKLRPNGEGQWRWFYKKVHSDMVLWEGTKERFEVVKSIPKPTPSAKKEQPTKPKNNSQPIWDEELDLPF